tara:strand:+ start:557 stop:844 length:288 start_codon:yes stop_codon:yes gene_type:complete
MKEEKFLFDMQRLALELDKTIDNYDLRDKTISLLVTGIFEETEEGNVKIKAVYSYNIQNKEELNSIIDFVKETWTDPDDDIDLSGLLDGTGIFLN